MNREAERKRLVELLRAMEDNATITCPRYSDGATLMTCNGCQYDMEDGSCDYAGREADHLLDNGIVVPPVKVGDKYVMDTAKSIFKAWNDVTGAVCEGTSWYYELESVIEDIVKLSFGAGVLYREDALKALEGSGEK